MTFCCAAALLQTPYTCPRDNVCFCDGDWVLMVVVTFAIIWTQLSAYAVILLLLFSYSVVVAAVGLRLSRVQRTTLKSLARFCMST